MARTRQPQQVAETAPVVETVPASEARALAMQVEFLQESMADLQLAMEDRGWTQLGMAVAMDFTAEGRKRIRDACRTMAVSHPLMKRGLQTRIGYIWGQGVKINAKTDESVAADVAALLDRFEKANATSLMSVASHEELERALGTDGEVFLAAFTDQTTGRVLVRSTPSAEVVKIITNPEDRDEPRYYVRQYEATVIDESGTSSTKTIRTVHPALDFQPEGPGRFDKIDGAEVMWDAPMVHLPVNRIDGMQHGIPDAYASLAWARLYRDFLLDWAKLTKALSRIAWKATGDTKNRARAAAEAAQAQALGVSDAGGTVATGPGYTFEAVSKSGATIDSDSGKPLATMIAAGFGLPVTMLLADPGVTGARATAETLDQPTILEMGMRRLVWQDTITRLLDHVLAAAIEAGAIEGTVEVDDWDRRTITAGGAPVVWDFAWPPMGGLDVQTLVAAIVAADSTGKMPSLVTVGLLLNALGVPDTDTVLASMTDADGNFIDPEASAGDAAAEAHRRGQDPASIY